MTSPSSTATRTITLFLLLTLGFSAPFFLLVNTKSAPLYITGLMWSPGLAAIATFLIRGRNLADLGWKWAPTRFQLLGYAIPPVFLFAVYAVIWLSEAGYFPNDQFVRDVSESMGWNGLSRAPSIVLYILLTGTIGMVAHLAFALGEELGWRGLLVPELAKTTTFTRTALISGFIWALWHFPVIMSPVYDDVRSPLWFKLLSFTLLAVGVSFCLTWLRLRTDSVWPAVFFHASFNLWSQDIFWQLTRGKEVIDYLGGDLGILVAAGGMVVGFLFWRKRALVEPTPPEPEVKAELAPRPSVTRSLRQPVSTLRT